MPTLKWKDLGLSYMEAAHGMQTAVKYELTNKLVGSVGSHESDPSASNRKHMRVGLNSAMVEHSALAYLLIAKGIITEAEYKEALRLAMNNELARYEAIHPGVSFR